MNARTIERNEAQLSLVRRGSHRGAFRVIDNGKLIGYIDIRNTNSPDVRMCVAIVNGREYTRYSVDAAIEVLRSIERRS
jgi:hypothetical protein